MHALVETLHAPLTRTHTRVQTHTRTVAHSRTHIGFWAEIKDDAEQLWTWQQHFVKLDKLGAEKKGEDGCELDQFWSAKFLEDMDKAITAKERKEALKEIDQDNNGKMALLEYCLW